MDSEILLKREDLNHIWLELELTQWRTPAMLRDIQLRRLQALLAHAAAHVPYYRALFARLGFDPAAITSPDDLRRLPVLTKADLQNHLGDLLADNYPRQALRADATGGSTGKPVSFYKDRTTQAWLNELVNRFRRWIGYLPQDKLALIWGNDRDKPADLPPNQIWLNSFNLTGEQIEAFMRDLVRFGPRAIRGYAGSLYLAASYLKKSGFSPRAPLAAGIESSAEKLWDWQRPVIEEMFGAKAFNLYGSREIPAIACECSQHRGLHVFADARVVEVIRDGLPAAPGQEGSLVVTDLLNYAMPLIRYEMGDIGRWADVPCPCGRCFPTLADVAGRVTSTISTPEGLLIHGEWFTHLFYGVAGVSAFQVRQRTREQVEVLVQPGEGFSADRVIEIVDKMRAKLGPRVEVGWRSVQEIPPAPSGKFHFTISDVPVDFLSPTAPAAPRSPRREGGKPRVLLIADVPGWIFDRHCQMLRKYLGGEFDFDVQYAYEPFNEDDYDLIYPLEWNTIKLDAIRTPGKYVTGIRSHKSWDSKLFPKIVKALKTHFCMVHVVSRRLLEQFAPLLPNVVYVTHGVETDFYRPATSPADSGTALRLGWAGNRAQAVKGFAEFVEPLGRLPGVELKFCGFSDNNLSREQMKQWYDSCDAIVCASASEGSSNVVLEAASMARAIITTDTGTVGEFLRDGHNALIVPRELPAFVRAVETLRDHPDQRASLGLAARRAVVNGWDWKDKARGFSLLFHGAIGR